MKKIDIIKIVILITIFVSLSLFLSGVFAYEGSFSSLSDMSLETATSLLDSSNYIDVFGSNVSDITNVIIFHDSNNSTYSDVIIFLTNNSTYEIGSGNDHWANFTYVGFFYRASNSSNWNTYSHFLNSSSINYNHTISIFSTITISDNSNVLCVSSASWSNGCISSPTVPVSLDSISLTTLPTITEYYQNDTISMEGAVVTAYYSDGSSVVVTDYTISPTVATDTGYMTITVTFEDKTTTFNITVNNEKTFWQKFFDFFNNFFDSLLHFVVPTNEQFSTLQTSFQDNVLSKFNIASWGNPNYNLDNVMDGILDAPRWDFTIFGATYTFDSQSIIDMLNTPISLGKGRIYTNNQSYGNTAPTGGLTPYTLIGIFLNIDMFILNIVLYNKFFSKGGDN